MKAKVLGAGLLTAMSWAYLRNIQLPTGPSRLDWGPLVFGHRGCREIAGIPENTLEAIEYAYSNGAAGVEIDIRLTRDDQLVVFHDAILNDHIMKREGHVRIDELDWIDVQRLVFEVDKTRLARIPSVEDVIVYCRDKKLKLLIEIKETQRMSLCVDKLLELFRLYPDYMYNETMVISFSPFALYNIRKKNCKVAVGMIHSGNVLQTLVEKKIDKCPAIIALRPSFFDALLHFGQTKLAPWIIGVSAMCPRYELYSEEYKRLWFKRGISVYVWGFGCPDHCTPSMKVKGVIVSSDNSYRMYEPEKTVPSYHSVFPDAPSNNQGQLPS